MEDDPKMKSRNHTVNFFYKNALQASEKVNWSKKIPIASGKSERIEKCNTATLVQHCKSNSHLFCSKRQKQAPCYDQNLI